MQVPPADWPFKGKIEFIDYTLQYRPELPAALLNINVCFNPGEKIGVVGRTGAGKYVNHSNRNNCTRSSLMVALFRLSEAARGKIILDGIDISHVSVKTLRSRLCVIPQVFTTHH